MPSDDAWALPLSDPAGFWNRRYAEPGYAYGAHPHDVLRNPAAAPPPGEALCLA